MRDCATFSDSGLLVPRGIVGTTILELAQKRFATGSVAGISKFFSYKKSVCQANLILANPNGYGCKHVCLSRKPLHTPLKQNN